MLRASNHMKIATMRQGIIMKQKHITRRAFALSSVALAAFGLASFVTVSAAEQPIPKPDGKPANMTLSAEGEKLQARYAAMLSALQAEIIKAVPAVDERKKAAFQEAREKVKKTKAEANAAQQSLGKIAGAAAMVDHAKGKWIGGAEQGIAAAEAALKKATTDAEREAAQKDLAKWQKNKEDGLKELVVREEALAAAKREEPKRLQERDAAAQALAQAQANELNTAQALLADAKPLLSSDKLDAQLVLCAVLADATPRGLAEFAQQGAEQAELVETLLADTGLMKLMLEAGGAKGAKYGQAMKIYTDIQKASPRAKDGILQRLALGTSLEMTVPFQQGFTSFLSSTVKPVDPVKRYLNYEQAYLAGELDPAFKGRTTWECRFVSNDPSSDEEIVWMREMLRNYRPDHVVNPDYKWRYVMIVRSDVAYGKGKRDPAAPILPMQQVLKEGGICHIRAWAGRLALRAFGIPAWGTEQGGHTAVGHWTPEGWVVNLGAGWAYAFWDGRQGTDFLIETQARQYPQDYLKALRAEWVGTALSETNYNNQTYSTKVLRPEIDGLWNVMALFEKKKIVADAKPVELAALGMELGEANESAETTAKAVEKAVATDDDKKVVVGADGVTIIPAAAFNGVQTMKSFMGGLQAFCAKAFSCEVEASRPGKYQLTARVVNVHAEGQLQLTANGGKDSVAMTIPYTIGMWQTTEPVEVTLVSGKNVLSFANQTKGFTFKDVTLTPVK